MQRHHALPALMVATIVLASCGSDEGGVGEDMLTDAVGTYADGVYASYATSLESATTMDSAIDAFVADPTAATMTAAKDAWLAARDDYGHTEAFRFSGGPIDNDEDGTEGLINAWPMDEAYVDYVEGDAEAGIVNNPDEFPTIDAALLTEANEAGGETNISTGWHAIEFLLWGQDLSARTARATVRRATTPMRRTPIVAGRTSSRCPTCCSCISVTSWPHGIRRRTATTTTSSRPPTPRSR